MIKLEFQQGYLTWGLSLFSLCCFSARKIQTNFNFRLIGNTLRCYMTKEEITHLFEVSLIWYRGLVKIKKKKFPTWSIASKCITQERWRTRLPRGLEYFKVNSSKTLIFYMSLSNLSKLQKQIDLFWSNCLHESMNFLSRDTETEEVFLNILGMHGSPWKSLKN